MALLRLSQSSKTIGAGEYSNSIMPLPVSEVVFDGGGGSSLLSSGECEAVMGDWDCVVIGDCDEESGDGC